MGRATQGEKAEIVRELREKGYQLKHLLKAMKLSRSTYYFELGKMDHDHEKNRTVMDLIREIFKANKGRYGARRVCGELNNQGVRVNHKKVQRLMHKMGLRGKRPKEKYHSYKGEVGKIADNLINRDFSTGAQLRKWTTDVTQSSLPWGEVLPFPGPGYEYE